MGREFQFNHKLLGLTYAQANGLSKPRLANFFKGWCYVNSKGEEITIKDFLICLECHQPREDDGFEGIHFHVFLSFTEKLRARDTTLFDLEDQFGRIYHPHFDKIKGIKNMVIYCTKEDKEPLATFDWEPYTVKRIKEEVDMEEVYNLDWSCGADFLDYVKGRWPNYFTNRYLQLKEIAKTYDVKKRKIFIPKYDDFRHVPPICSAWVDNELKPSIEGTKDRPAPLLLLGKGKTGKTSWARSLGKHLYFQNYFNLKKWDDDVDYIILDDMDSNGKPLEECFRSWKPFFGAQLEFELCDKYMPKVSIENWGKPCIWISNSYDLNCNSNNYKYIHDDLHAYVCRIHNNLY